MSLAIERALAEMDARAKRVVKGIVGDAPPASPAERNRARTDHHSGHGMALWNLLNSRKESKWQSSRR